VLLDLPIQMQKLKYMPIQVMVILQKQATSVGSYKKKKTTIRGEKIFCQ
jgi:hypothetical protein